MLVWMIVSQLFSCFHLVLQSKAIVLYKMAVISPWRNLDGTHTFDEKKRKMLFIEKCVLVSLLKNFLWSEYDSFPVSKTKYSKGIQTRSPSLCCQYAAELLSLNETLTFYNLRSADRKRNFSQKFRRGICRTFGAPPLTAHCNTLLLCATQVHSAWI